MRTARFHTELLNLTLENCSKTYPLTCNLLLVLNRCLSNKGKATHVGSKRINDVDNQNNLNITRMPERVTQRTYTPMDINNNPYANKATMLQK